MDRLEVKLFKKILNANKGEIAVRIVNACKEMGISTVAVYSEADKDALHVKLADEKYCIGNAHASKSYLDMQNIFSSALVSKAEAIHPSYGFLSENPQFASLCNENNIVFIGLPADIIARMGDKSVAKQTMESVDFPLILGSELVADISNAKKQAQSIGFPLLIKARSG